MENQLYTYKCVCYVDGEEVHRAGLVAATSYGTAAEQIEGFFSPELSCITHLSLLVAAPIFSLPCTKLSSNKDLIDLIEAEAF